MFFISLYTIPGAVFVNSCTAYTTIFKKSFCGYAETDINIHTYIHTKLLVQHKMPDVIVLKRDITRGSTRDRGKSTGPAGITIRSNRIS